jgi:soluble lytic murein transglycosylase
MYLHPLKYRSIINQEAKRHQIDPYLLAAIIFEESHFRPRSLSSAGAVGLMQIMPKTAIWIWPKVKKSKYDPAKLVEPRTNIALGSWYFAFLKRKYKSEILALAAYNSGDKNLDNWLKGKKPKHRQDVLSVIPFRETRQFVNRVQRSRDSYRLIYPEAF